MHNTARHPTQFKTRKLQIEIPFEFTENTYAIRLPQQNKQILVIHDLTERRRMLFILNCRFRNNCKRFRLWGERKHLPRPCLQSSKGRQLTEIQLRGSEK